MTFVISYSAELPIACLAVGRRVHVDLWWCFCAVCEAHHKKKAGY